MIRALTIAATLLACAPVAKAEVKAADDIGFVVQIVQKTALNPDQAYKAALAIQRWWSSDHTYSGSASNLSLEVKPGGCWCETLEKNGGFVRHMSLEYADPGASLRFNGALGPLANLGAQGMLLISFTPDPQGAVITATYRINGRVDGGWARIASAVDRVLTENFARMAALTPS